MMHPIDKWKIDVDVDGRQQMFWISENHLGNVLRRVAEMSFSENGLIQPTTITITLVRPPLQVGTQVRG